MERKSRTLKLQDREMTYMIARLENAGPGIKSCGHFYEDVFFLYTKHHGLKLFFSLTELFIYGNRYRYANVDPILLLLLLLLLYILI